MTPSGVFPRILKDSMPFVTRSGGDTLIDCAVEVSQMKSNKVIEKMNRNKLKFFKVERCDVVGVLFRERGCHSERSRTAERGLTLLPFLVFSGLRLTILSYSY